MALLKSGSNGAGDAADYCERDYQIFSSDEIALQPWASPTDAQPVQAAYEYWLTCRDGKPVPSAARFDEQRLTPLGWRLRKIDVRARAPGDFAVITTEQPGQTSILRFRQLDDFARDCLTHDVLQCAERRAALFIVAVHRQSDFMFCCREVLLPVTDANLDVGWIYAVMSYDDEKPETLSQDAELITLKA